MAILLYPIMALPFALLTAVNNPGWREGVISDVSRGTWVVVALVYVGLIVWTIAKAIGYRVERGFVEARMTSEDVKVLSTVEAARIPSEYLGAEVPRVAWLAIRTQGDSASLYWRDGSQLRTAPLASGEAVVSLSIDASSYAPTGRPVLEVQFAEAPTLRVEFRGPFGSLWPPTPGRMERTVREARR